MPTNLPDFSKSFDLLEKIYKAIDAIVMGVPLKSFSLKIQLVLYNSEKDFVAMEKTCPHSKFLGYIGKYEREASDRISEVLEYLPRDGSLKKFHKLGESGKYQQYFDKITKTMSINVSMFMTSWIRFLVTIPVFFPDLHWDKLYISCLGSGYIPLYWRGEYPKGYLVAYAWPRRAMPLPEHCIPTKEELTAYDIKKQKPIDRTKLPKTDYPIFNTKEWGNLLSLPIEKATRSIILPLLPKEGKITKELLDIYVRQARKISIETHGKRKYLVLSMINHANQNSLRTIYFSPPWEGPLEGLPPAVAQVIRRHNGIFLNKNEDFFGETHWRVYEGPKRLFPIEWKLWSIRNHPNGLLKKMPISPFSNGQDLWIYHPGRLHEGHLELLHVSHEDEEITVEKIQHAGACFLNLLKSEFGMSFSLR